jgi:hypothetical protein
VLAAGMHVPCMTLFVAANGFSSRAEPASSKQAPTYAGLLYCLLPRPATAALKLQL